MMFARATLEDAMGVAMEMAASGIRSGELPYGAVVVSRDGEIVARTHDTIAHDNDPTCHCEIECIRRAVSAVGPDLQDYALVSNAEPCSLCASAAWWARIGAIAYGLSTSHVDEILPEKLEMFGPSARELMGCFERRPEIVSGVLAGKCREHMQEMVASN